MARKAKVTSAPEPEAEPSLGPMGDTHALLAKLRAQDEEAIEEAYRLTFATVWGRFVLAHIAHAAGVGRRFGAPELTRDVLAYHQGGHDVALDILERAGFDPSSAALMVMTGRLEGRDDERSALPDGHAEADPELPD